VRSLPPTAAEPRFSAAQSKAQIDDSASPWEMTMRKTIQEKNNALVLEARRR
jgi:hypothetical protein